MLGNNFLLWEDDEFVIKTPFNPHIPYEVGLHLVVTSKFAFRAAWDNPTIAAQAFELSARACKLMEDNDYAPWFNIQANANWGVLPGATPFFHLYVYGRNKTDRWGKPLVLPEARGAYQNEPMPEAAREQLASIFQSSL